MIRVRQDNFGIKIGGQIPLGDSLHGGLCADRHEHGGFDRAMRGMQQAGPGLGDGALCLKFESHDQSADRREDRRGRACRAGSDDLGGVKLLFELSISGLQPGAWLELSNVA